MKILALDLGKSKSAVCILDTAEMKERYTTVGTTPFELTILLERQRPDRVVFEVGTLSGWVHDLAVRQGCMVQVANPNHEGWRWRNVKHKSDRLDALKLAKLSVAGQLPTVHMPASAVREHRALIQYRSQLVGRRTRIKNTIRSLIARQGRGMASGAVGWTLVHFIWQGLVIAALLAIALRLMRPSRCSRRDGFHGKSTLMSVPRVWRFKPSQAASVATT